VQALDQGQIKSLLAALRGHRLFALFALDCTLGLRRGELIGLRWRNVRLDGPKPHIRVREQLQRFKNEATGKRERVRVTTKTKAGARIIPLSAALVDLLLAHKEQQKLEREIIGASWHGEDLVFTSELGGPINERNLLRTLKRALRRAQLPDVSLHSLRHSASSIMLSNGGNPVDVAAILGHSSPEITVRIYAHSFDEGRQEAVEGASGILHKKSNEEAAAEKAPNELEKPSEGREAEK
jgi:integrase